MNPPRTFDVPPPSEGEFSLRILWGSDEDSTPELYSFESAVERDAFVYGIEQGHGWDKYEMAGPNQRLDSEANKALEMELAGRFIVSTGQTERWFTDLPSAREYEAETNGTIRPVTDEDCTDPGHCSFHPELAEVQRTPRELPD